MATLIARQLTDELYRRLNGEDLAAHAEKVILVLTVDTEGWPHPAMLSHFEVVAKDRENVRLATYNDSRTTANMLRNGKLTLVVVDKRLINYIKGTVEEIAHEMRCTPYNAKLNMRVEQVLSDEANQEVETGAYVAGGIVYFDPNRSAGLESARALLAELLE